MRIDREWAMPNRWTFTINPIRELIGEEMRGALWIDPFCGQSSLAQITNDLNPGILADYHLDALSFLRAFESDGADGCLFDPPYSITKAVECYQSFGKEQLQINVGNMQYWAECKNEIARVLRVGGKAICCGWTSMGLGQGRGFRMERVLLVPHGGSKNDTIITVECKQRSARLPARLPVLIERRIRMTKRKKLAATYPSPRWSGEILDCGLPMTFDQFDKCSYNCLYCFSFFQKILKTDNPLFKIQKDFTQEPVATVNMQRVRSIWENVRLGKCVVGQQGDAKGEWIGVSQFYEYVRNGLTFQWGGLADPFDEYERRYRVGLPLMRFLREWDDGSGYPICFSTKGCWWMLEADGADWRNVIRGCKKWFFKVSIINLDASRARLVERGVESPQRRLEALRRVRDLDIGGTALRLRPFLIGLSDREEEYLELIRQAAEAGIDAVSTEFFCLEARANEKVRERYRKMSEVLGFDVFDFYKRNSVHSSGYLRLNWKIKKKYVLKMEELCRRLGVRFHVSDAHYKELGVSGCCCGLPEADCGVSGSPTMPFARGQFTEAVVLARKRFEGTGNGRVYFSDISPHLSILEKIRWIHAENFNTSNTHARCARWNQMMPDYIRSIWNDPNNGKSPYKYFGGVLFPVGTDDCGDIVYEYRPRNAAG